MFHAGTRDDVIEAKERRSRPHGVLAIGRAVINKFRRCLARVFPQGFDRLQVGILGAGGPFHVSCGVPNRRMCDTRTNDGLHGLLRDRTKLHPPNRKRQESRIKLNDNIKGDCCERRDFRTGRFSP
jgi:hypothetical protein